MLLLDNVDEILVSDEKSFYALLKRIFERRAEGENCPNHAYGMVEYFDIRIYFEKKIQNPLFMIPYFNTCILFIFNVKYMLIIYTYKIMIVVH